VGRDYLCEKLYRGESGVAVFAVRCDGFAVSGVLLGVRKKPFDRLLIIIVLLTLDNNLQKRNIQKPN
jgi:hypothetical protein